MLALLGSYDIERRPAARRVLALTHAAFWAEAATSPIPAFLRGALAPLAAPGLPLLLRQPLLVAEGVRVLSQLRVGYRHSPLSVEAAGPPGAARGPVTGSRTPR